MPTIRSDTLPWPSSMSPRSTKRRRRSTFGNMIFSADPDAQVAPTVYVFEWQDVRREVADAVRRHFDEHHAAAFDFTSSAGVTYRLQWRGPPAIQWGTGAAASATGELELVLAKE